MTKSHQKKIERFREILSGMRDELDAMAGSYGDKFDDASEKWQQSERGQEYDTEREQLELAAADVEAAESTLADLCS